MRKLMTAVSFFFMVVFMRAPVAVAGSDPVWVLKYDGSKQCFGFQNITSLESSKEELEKANIDILGAVKSQDGKNHVMACGYSTGIANFFMIQRSQLLNALQLGFQLYSGYSDGNTWKSSPPGWEVKR